MTELKKKLMPIVSHPRDREFIAVCIDDDGIYEVVVDWREDDEMFVSQDGRGSFPSGFFTHWRKD